MSNNLPVIFASFGAVFIVSKLWRAHMEMSKLDGIPVVGSDGFWGSFWSGIRYIKHAREVIQEGYDKYYGRAFKVRMPDRWEVVATGPILLNDIRKAPDDVMSLDEATSDFLQLDYTVGSAVRTNFYHVNVVKGPLTRNISTKFSDVRDEIISAFGDEVPASDDWVAIPAVETIMKIVCRTSNRLFVGLPLCRDPDWLDLNMQYTIKVFGSASIINIFPSILKPIIGTILSPKANAMRRARRHVGRIVQERMDKEEQYGKVWADKPNDLISWLIDENPGGQYRTVDDILTRLLFVNMGAIHTTSMTFSQTLYWLAIQPQSVIDELRNEIESVTENHGWNKASMSYLRKVDSFMKEVARFTGLGEVVFERKVLKDFTLSDGTCVPAGSVISIPVNAMHHDERHYKNANEFKPFRFSEMRDSEEGGSIKHQMITPNQDYVFFGIGRHACPGRFFAVNELKTLVAHTLLTYDIQLEGESKVIPEPTSFINALLPNQTAKVLFRKRRV